MRGMRGARSPLPPKKQLSFFVPGDVWLLLKTVTAALGKTQAAVVAEALRLYVAQLSPRERRAIEELRAVRQKP